MLVRQSVPAIPPGHRDDLEIRVSGKEGAHAYLVQEITINPELAVPLEQLNDGPGKESQVAEADMAKEGNHFLKYLSYPILEVTGQDDLGS